MCPGKEWFLCWNNQMSYSIRKSFTFPAIFFMSMSKGNPERCDVKHNAAHIQNKRKERAQLPQLIFQKSSVCRMKNGLKHWKSTNELNKEIRVNNLFGTKEGHVQNSMFPHWVTCYWISTTVVVLHPQKIPRFVQVCTAVYFCFSCFFLSLSFSSLHLLSSFAVKLPFHQICFSEIFWVFHVIRRTFFLSEDSHSELCQINKWGHPTV